MHYDTEFRVDPLQPEAKDHRERLELQPCWRLLFPPADASGGEAIHRLLGWQTLGVYQKASSILFNQLALSGKLKTYLADLNEQAHDRLELIMQQMKKA